MVTKCREREINPEGGVVWFRDNEYGMHGTFKDEVLRTARVGGLSGSELCPASI